MEDDVSWSKEEGGGSSRELLEEGRVHVLEEGDLGEEVSVFLHGDIFSHTRGHVMHEVLATRDCFTSGGREGGREGEREGGGMKGR